MATIPNTTLPGGSQAGRKHPALPSDERNSAQSLRPTFEGWGPRI
jgi:hypothetical protein